MRLWIWRMISRPNRITIHHLARSWSRKASPHVINGICVFCSEVHSRRTTVKRISTLMRSMKNIFGRSCGSRSSMTGWCTDVMVGTRDEPFILMVNPLLLGGLLLGGLLCAASSSDLPGADDSVDLAGRLLVALRTAHDLECVQPRLRGIEEGRQIDGQEPVGRLVVAHAIHDPGSADLGVLRRSVEVEDLGQSIVF